MIDYVYLAGPKCRVDDPALVDQPGIRVGVPKGASADAFLSRRLKLAQVVPLRASQSELIKMLQDGAIDLYASGTEGLQALQASLPGSRIIGQFETVVFAASTPQGLSAEDKLRLAQIVEEAKAAGVIQRAIDHSGKNTVRAAPTVSRPLG